MIGIVYLTVNQVNGKKYIGQHRCKTEKDSYLGSGKTLKKAIEKYGKENFKRITLYKAETEKELDEKEIAFISAFRATERDDYYNICEGGFTGRIMKGKNNPFFGKFGPSNPNFGKKRSEEVKRRMSEAQKGHLSNTTEEVRQKISETMKAQGIKPCALAYSRLKGKKGSINAGRPHKHVLCVELGIVFESQSEIERQLNIPQANVWKVLNKQREKAGGYHFVYTESEVTPYDTKNWSNN